MTISPPSNVRLLDGEPAKVLARGVDSLVLALYVECFENTCFNKLAEIKQEAVATGQPAPGILSPDGAAGPWVFTVRPHGADGYEWLLQSGEMSMKIGHWVQPIQRPSVMVEIRSETLWTHGVDACVDRVLSLLQSVNGNIIKCQLNRVDLCVDVLLPDSIWHLGLMENIVTRATKEAQPLIRAKAVGGDIDQLSKQTLGHLTSLIALFRQRELIQPGETLDLASHLPLIVGLIRNAGWDDAKFTAEVKKKQAKRMRHTEKFAAARGALKALGVSLKRPAKRRPPGAT